MLDHAEWNTDDLPGITYYEVKEFLGEVPWPRYHGINYSSFSDIFKLLWMSTDKKEGGVRRWNAPYLRAYRKALSLLQQGGDPDRLAQRLRRLNRDLFEYYCPCITAPSANQLITKHARGNHAAWLSFNEECGIVEGNPLREEGPYVHPRKGGSWSYIRNRIQWDRLFSLSATEVTRPGDIRDEIMNSKEYIEFVGYSGRRLRLSCYYNRDQSHRERKEWIDQAKRERSKLEDLAQNHWHTRGVL